MSATTTAPHLKPQYPRSIGLDGLEFGSLGQSVSYLIRRAQIELSRQFVDDVGKHHRISYGGFSALILIGTNPGIDQIQIAQMLGLDKANTASLIRGLVQDGWLSRRQPLRDRRCQGVFLTPAGVSRLAVLKREMREFERRFCRSLSDAERMTVVPLLQRLCFATKLTAP